jgi:hypothetical protein
VHLAEVQELETLEALEHEVLAWAEAQRLEREARPRRGSWLTIDDVIAANARLLAARLEREALP